MRSAPAALLALLAIFPASAAGDEVETVLQRLLEAQTKNNDLAGQYAYVEQADFFAFDKNGKARKDSSQTHEVIFVEGLPYKKLIARDDRPLAPREEAKERSRLQRIAAERRQQRAGTSGLLHRTVSMGSDADLLRLFTCRLTGEEEIRGHAAWMVDCTPKPDYLPANQAEKEALSFRRQLWIDRSEYLTVKSVHTAIRENAIFLPGSTSTWEYEKINGDAWLTVSGVIEGRLHFAKLIKPRVRTEYRNTKFQKFDVQSTITMIPAR